MKKHIYFLLLFPFILNAQSDRRLKGLDKQLNEILKETKAPGFAVAIVEGSEVVYAKGFGYRDYENKIPADANTLFPIGSCTKAFTSAVLGQLRDEEKLSFDDSPIQYIPELRFYNNEMNNGITIEDMMYHRTGLPRHDYSWYLFPSNNKDSLLMRLRYHEPYIGLRKEWHYNNFMYLGLGVIAERLTGNSWEDNVRERFFEPLEMTRSNLSIKELEGSENVALGYTLTKDKEIKKLDYYHISGMSPAGSINSSVNEMSNWLKVWINKGVFEGEEIISPEYIKEAITGHMAMGEDLPDEEFEDIYMSSYGYAWMNLSYKGHYRVSHGGNIDGFSANVAFYPTDSMGVIILTNQHGSAVTGIVRNIVADRMLRLDRTDWLGRHIQRTEKAQSPGKTEDLLRARSTEPSHLLEEFAGHFSHPGYGTFEVAVKNDSLFADFERMRFYLRHYHYNIFEPLEIKDGVADTTDPSSLRFNFSTNDVGEIAAVNLKFEALLDPISFKRTAKAVAMSEATLEQYVGDYVVSDTEMKIYIKNKKLYAFVQGQPEYELMATGNHQFSLKIIEGYKIEFVEGENGVITGLLMIQPNGTFKAERK